MYLLSIQASRNISIGGASLVGFPAQAVFLPFTAKGGKPYIEQAGSFCFVAFGLIEDALDMGLFHAGQGKADGALWWKLASGCWCCHFTGRLSSMMAKPSSVIIHLRGHAVFLHRLSIKCYPACGALRGKATEKE